MIWASKMWGCVKRWERVPNYLLSVSREPVLRPGGLEHPMLFAWWTLSSSGLRSETRLKLGSGRRIPGWLCGRFDLLHGDEVVCG
jgi:hypothetical protein